MDTSFVAKAINQQVLARVRKSVELGTKATWSSEDHKRMMGEVLMQAAATATSASDWAEVAHLIYNHSAHAQTLERQFAGTGHFQRKVKDARSLDDIMAELAKGS